MKHKKYTSVKWAKWPEPMLPELGRVKRQEAVPVSDLRSTTFTGRVGRDPERSMTSGDKPQIRFSVAVKKWGKVRGEESMWISCVAFGTAVEPIDKGVEQGDLIGISGDFWLSEWKDKEGKLRTTLEVMVGSFQVLAKKKQRQESGDPFMEDLP